jgi:hypothetical protein
MSEHYPRIRIRVESGALMIREAVNITLYMRHSHAEVARTVLRSLDIYRHAVQPHKFRRYSHDAGAWLELDTEGWEKLRREFLERSGAILHLLGGGPGQREYRFVYHGRPIDAPTPWGDEPGRVCAVNFWLPTEYLEQYGPGRVRELALELGSPLPFCSGHAGLAFNCETDVVGTWGEVFKLCFRHPGMSIPDPDLLSLELGTRIQTVNWLTFLGHPVLGELGGAAGLRSRLYSPDTTVQELEGERVVVTLGPWPEAGDSAHGDVLPAYRELAHVLEPWLFQAPRASEEVRRWERRFLD